MKKALFLLSLISIFCLNVQGQVVFPQDFKLDSKLLDGMAIAKIPEEAHSEGITDNPAVTQDRSIIKMLSDLDNEHIIQVYYEIYQSIGNEHDDAGVIVCEFESKEALLDCLPYLKIQSNLGYLAKDNYLIQIWSDSSKNGETQINNMVSYYQNTLQANKVFNIGGDDSGHEIETISESEVPIVKVLEEENKSGEIMIQID